MREGGREATSFPRVRRFTVVSGLTHMEDADRLIELVSAVSGDQYLKVEESLGDGYVRLRVSEAERRQAKHDIRTFEDVVIELLRNARDAHAQRVFIATAREGSQRTLTMIDDGIGIPRALAERVFEPRVTSKLDTMVVDRWGVHGRGMALFSVRANVSDARVVVSAPHKGTSILVRADADELPERTDQSTWPVVERTDAGDLSVAKGPHNIVRRVLEFACEHPEIDIYLGSFVEIATTLSACARADLDTADLLFCDDSDRLPVWQRLSAASDAADLVAASLAVGLQLSERTAHRMLSGELVPLETVLVRATPDESAPAPPEPDIYRDRRGLKIHQSDLDEFRAEITAAFDRLAERYYIHLKGEPRISVGRDHVRIRFDMDKED